MTTEINRADLLDLRDRINDLEVCVAKNNVRMGFISALLSLTIPSVITLIPFMLGK